MTRERRVFNLYPLEQRTPQNNRETSVLDDVMFEPEQADFLNGFIGDISVLTADDLARVPQIFEITPERQKNQLSIGVNFINPANNVREAGAYFTDLVNQIAANGGLVNDQNRIFRTNFYAWTPPIEYDKHINFSRYRWTGAGTADINGEYVTKEAAHSKTTIYENDGVAFVKRDVTVVNGLPAVGPVGTYVEDGSTVDRYIYISDGAVWNLVDFDLFADIPTSVAGFLIGETVYVTRTGPEFNRPLVWQYSEPAGRWIAQPVVVSTIVPESPRDGMVWEDARVPPRRRLKRFENGTFVDLVYTPQDGPAGVGTDGEYIYDTRDYSTLTDPWVTENWWRHYEDLSPADLTALTFEDQAIRPIIEFWNGIEGVAGDTRDFRNDAPVFKKFAYDGTDIVDTTEQTTIFQYQAGTGDDDFVIGFPISFSPSGEVIFELTLETDSSAFIGYKYFRDSITGFAHPVWFKSDVQTVQEQDSNGVFCQPVTITSNSDHGILTVASRENYLSHMTDVISAQTDFQGDKFGLNSYRWTKKSPTLGSTIIDPEQSLLRAIALLQSRALDMPNAIRLMAKEYNKVLFKFINKLNQFWDDETISDGGTDTLIVTPAEAVDAILTNLFIVRTDEFPFALSDMGEYLETRIEAGIAIPLDPGNPRPIFIPPSASRVGASACFDPQSFVDRDGITKLRGHDGNTVESFGDDRDLVWLELQDRFFDATPVQYCTETDAFTARFSNYFLDDYYGNFVPLSVGEPVDDVVEDFNTEPTPPAGTLWFSRAQGVYASFNGASFLFRRAVTDDVFLNLSNGEYYIFNGLNAFEIDRWNRPFAFDYTDNEYRQIIRRDFERFTLFIQEDFTENTTFNEADKFTWNYRSAGVEGNYKGIYRRIYFSIRPHSHPWEVVGYKVEPDWWRTQYVPDSTAADGTPRYGSGHSMWTDFQLGFVNKPTDPFQKDQFIMAAPIPVDAAGELLDPIAAGVVDIDKLDLERTDDFWIYGDGGPVEQAWIDSAFYAFTISLAGFLMKNGIWTDTLWSEVFIGIGDGTIPLYREPHIIHRDTRTRPALEEIPVHLQVVNGVTTQRLGVNAWISEFVNVNGGSPTVEFGVVLQNSSPALSWKTAGFINQARTIVSTLSSEEIPFEDVHVLVHESQPIETKFASGVLVIREDTGYRVFGYDPFVPFFTVERPAIPITGGQVELREDFTVMFIDDDEYNITGGTVFPNKTVNRLFQVTEFTLPVNSNTENNDTAKVSVLINGARIKSQHISILANNFFKIEDRVELEPGDIVSISTVTTQSSPSTQTKQFFINGVAFPYFGTGSGEYDRVEYGRFFSSSTEVINFMIGYGRFLESEGWVFDTQAAIGTTAKDWLYGAQQFARWVLDTESPWNPDPKTPIEDRGQFEFSPFDDFVKFVSPFGMSLNVESIMNGAYGILNNRSEPIPSDETFVTRIEDTLTIDRVDTTNDFTGIFGVRVNLTETEHVVFFSNVTRFNDLIYDPVTAQFHQTFQIDSYRTLNWQGRLEANGYIINGGQLLPNFEKQAFDFTRFYDRYNTIDDPTRREQARNLYGFVPANQSKFRSQTETLRPRTSTDQSQYMIATQSTDRTRFDYYRGMIQTKGTVRPIFAFARGTKIGRDAVIVNEDWAWKLQEYGDVRREVLQFRVEKNDFRDEVQTVAFTDQIVLNNNTLEILPFDRNNPDANPRWIRPPEFSKDLTCNVEFPVTSSGLPDVANNDFFGKLFDTETGFTILDHVQYDPDVLKFDTNAECQLDYTDLLDPARYNVGPGAAFSNETCWGFNQVNELWWSTERRTFVDYRSLLPNYEDAAKQWGRLKFFKANITRVDDIVTVETLDPFGSGAVVPHGTPVSDVITVSFRGAAETEYNLQQIDVTATSTTEYEYSITTQPDSPATGNPEIVLGAMDIFQWVKSPVPPQDWEVYVETLNDPELANGVPLNVDNPSYVQLVDTNEFRQSQNVYFFWVRNSSGTNIDKKFTPLQIAERLAMPTALNIPWFAPVDADNMLIFTDGEKVEDGYAFEVLIDRRNLETHVEWVLVSENNQFESIPQVVVDKMIDSMSQVDEFGNTVPSPLLSEEEKYGACFFPIQTVFRDVAAAIDVYVEALNTILQGKNLSEVDNLTGVFKLTTELSDANPTGFWQRAAFVDPSVVGQSVYETVATLAERDLRFTNGFYAEGDIVRVLESGNDDPWTGAEVASNFLLSGGLFLTVGIDNNTVAVNSNLALDTALFRQIYSEVYDILEKIEQNNLMFSLLNEMLIQDLHADWFFKTSYITTQVFTQADSSPFVRADETVAIRENILDVKPFRTKVRSETNTLGIPLEDVPVQIIEFPDKKISLLYDRLSCNLLDDCTWGSGPWGTEEIPCSPEWGMPIWDFANLGQEQFYFVEQFVGDAVTTEWIADALYDPTTYNVRIVLLQNGVEVDLDNSGISFVIIKTHTQIIVRVNTLLPPSFIVQVFQAQGFYSQEPDFIGTTLEGTLFQPAPPDYKHFVARTLVTGDDFFDPRSVMIGCTDINDPLGGRPEERVVAETCELMNLYVVNEYTEAYKGWGATPWGSGGGGWGIGVNDAGARVFVIAVGKETEIPAGLLMIPTSEDIAVITVNPNIAIGVNPKQEFEIAQVELQKGGIGSFDLITEGVEYEFVDNPLLNIVQSIVPEDEEFVADGATTSFQTVGGTSISHVFRNGLLEAQGVDYNLDTTETLINWVQPASTIIEEFGTAVGRSHVGDAVTSEFDTGTNADILQRKNAFVFINGDLQQFETYTPDTGTDLSLSRQESSELDFTGVTGASLPAGAVPGAWFDVSTTTATYRFWFSDGATTPPAVAGEILTAIAFTGAETDQAISNLVVATLLGADPEFSNAINGGGATPIISLTIVTAGSTPDAVDGAVSTGAVFTTVVQGLLTIPGLNDQLLFYTFNNTLGDPDGKIVVFTLDEFTAAPLQTVFNTTSGGFGTNDRTFVFVDGRYQVAGVDYNIGPTDTVTFTAPLGGGEAVDIRVLDSPIVDIEHITFTTSGGVSDTIPGITDADDPQLYMLFRDDVLQDGYTTTGTPDFTIFSLFPADDVINWTVFAEFTTLDFTFITGASLPTGVTPGAWFDVSSTAPATYRFWFSDGSTTPPAVAGEILTAIAFTGAETDQAISDLVVTALIGADADFVGASNGGGATTAVSVTLATIGSVPDAADGAVSTGASIVVQIQGTDPPPPGQDVSFRYIRKARVRETVIVNVLPQANDVIVARLNPFFEPGDNIRYRFNGWKVGSQGTFNVSSVPQDDYDINREGIFRFATLPDENEFITLNYLVPRKAPAPESILVRMAEIVADVLADHEAYTEPNGFNEFRAVGTRIIDTTDSLVYNWNGFTWIGEGVPLIGTQFFVTRKQEIWEFDGAVFNKIFDNGDAFPKPPLLDYPLFGRGITFATYAFGQGPDAPIEWPDAYEVMQHPGAAPL